MLVNSQIFNSLVASAIDAIVVVDSNNVVVSANPSTERLTGWAISELVGSSLSKIIPERFRDRHENGIKQFLEHRTGIVLGSPFARLPIVRKDGEEVMTHISIAHFQEDGKDYFTGIMRDVTDLMTHEEQRNTLIKELNHRVKNTMSIILSVISQTAKDAPSVFHFRDVLHDRVYAMGQTHDLLVDGDWGTVLFVDLLEKVLDPLGRPWTYKGPDLCLKPSVAVNLGMVIHELATNACKHGSWSTSGDVCIDTTAANDNVTISWSEIDGPPAKKPKTGGFGMKLMSRGLGGSPGSKIDLKFKKTGFSAEIMIPLSQQVVLKY